MRVSGPAAPGCLTRAAGPGARLRLLRQRTARRRIGRPWCRVWRWIVCGGRAQGQRGVCLRAQRCHDASTARADTDHDAYPRARRGPCDLSRRVLVLGASQAKLMIVPRRPPSATPPEKEQRHGALIFARIEREREMSYTTSHVGRAHAGRKR